MKYLIVLIILLPFVSSEFTVDQEGSKVIIAGTSTVHDWESIVNEFSVTGNWDESKITNLKATVEVLSIESGKPVMDTKTFRALKQEEHPQIILSADQLMIEGEKITGMSMLNVAGASKEMPVDATITTQDNSSIMVTGELTMKMTEFGIEPPTALFGSLKTGDEITVRYDFLIKK